VLSCAFKRSFFYTYLTSRYSSTPLAALPHPCQGKHSPYHTKYISCQPETDLHTVWFTIYRHVLSPKHWFANKLGSQSTDRYCHPKTDLHTTPFKIQRHIFWPKHWFAQNLIHNPATYLCHPKTDLHKSLIHNIVTQRLLYTDKLDSQSRDIHILSLKDWFVHRNDSQDPQTNLFITQILTCNTNLIHNSRCKPEERQYLQRNRPPHKFVKTLTSSGKEVEVYPEKPKLGFSVSRLTWSTY
jgi:hypothetical protein